MNTMFVIHRTATQHVRLIERYFSYPLCLQELPASSSQLFCKYTSELVWRNSIVGYWNVSVRRTRRIQGKVQGPGYWHYCLFFYTACCDVCSGIMFTGPHDNISNQANPNQIKKVLRICVRQIINTFFYWTHTLTPEFWTRMSAKYLSWCWPDMLFLIERPDPCDAFREYLLSCCRSVPRERFHSILNIFCIARLVARMCNFSTAHEINVH